MLPLLNRRWKSDIQPSDFSLLCPPSAQTSTLIPSWSSMCGVFDSFCQRTSDDSHHSKPTAVVLPEIESHLLRMTSQGDAGQRSFLLLSVLCCCCSATRKPLHQNRGINTVDKGQQTCRRSLLSIQQPPYMFILSRLCLDRTHKEQITML